MLFFSSKRCQPPYVAAAWLLLASCSTTESAGPSLTLDGAGGTEATGGAVGAKGAGAGTAGNGGHAGASSGTGGAYLGGVGASAGSGSSGKGGGAATGSSGGNGGSVADGGNSGAGGISDNGGHAGFSGTTNNGGKAGIGGGSGGNAGIGGGSGGNAGIGGGSGGNPGIGGGNAGIGGGAAAGGSGGNAGFGGTDVGGSGDAGNSGTGGDGASGGGGSSGASGGGNGGDSGNGGSDAGAGGTGATAGAGGGDAGTSGLAGTSGSGGSAGTGGTAASPLGAPVLTRHNDNGRTGANLGETLLTPANVSLPGFGKLFTRAVDDMVYAQVLYVPGATIAGKGIHDIIVVATMNDTVYAFDAHDPAQAQPLWQTSFLDAANGIVPVKSTDVGTNCKPYTDIVGNIGIVGTPAIDPITATLYLVSRTKDQSGHAFQHLHALDLSTGLDRPGSPLAIAASIQATGAGSVNGTITFDPWIQNQRAGLVIANGTVYVAWGSHCESGQFHGWVMGYDATTLAQKYLFNTTPTGFAGGIWMSGQGPSVDANGNVYLATSTGDFDANVGGASYSQTQLAFHPDLSLKDWFAPFDAKPLSMMGRDVGSTGVLQIPGTTLLALGTKASVVYVTDRDNLGHWKATSNSQIVQSLTLGGGELHGAPIAWDVPGGARVYLWAAGDALRAFRVTNGKLAATGTGPTTPSTAQPGGVLSLSANGATSGTGIVWATLPLLGDQSLPTRPGMLMAIDAETLVSVWNSLAAPGDDFGTLAKFAPPTVSGGKVFVPTFSKGVAVYGLKQP